MMLIGQLQLGVPIERHRILQITHQAADFAPPHAILEAHFMTAKAPINQRPLIISVSFATRKK